MLTIVFNQLNGYVVPDLKIEEFVKNFLNEYKSGTMDRVIIGSRVMLNMFVAELMEQKWDPKDVNIIYNDPVTGNDYKWYYSIKHGLGDIEILGDNYKDIPFKSLLKIMAAQSNDGAWTALANKF